MSANSTSAIWMRARSTAGSPFTRFTVQLAPAGPSTVFSGSPKIFSRSRPRDENVTASVFSINRTGTSGSPFLKSSRFAFSVGAGGSSRSAALSVETSTAAAHGLNKRRHPDSEPAERCPSRSVQSRGSMYRLAGIDGYREAGRFETPFISVYVCRCSSKVASRSGGLARVASGAQMTRTNDLKMAIRRRLYRERVRAGLPPGDLAPFFTSCAGCQGRGKVCIESLNQGVATATLDSCPQCGGDGFVERSK